MSFLGKVLGGTVDFAKFVATDIADHAIIRDIRREHDAWMRDCQYGVPYYTLAPNIPLRDDLPWTRDTHIEAVFTGERGQWPLNYQLKATNGWLSWALWFEHGPLTTEWKPTAEYYELQDALEEPRMHARMQARLMTQIDAGARATHERAMADVKRRYPKSAALLTASR